MNFMATFIISVFIANVIMHRLSPYQYFSGPLTDKEIIATECIVIATANGTILTANGNGGKKKDCRGVGRQSSG